MLFNEALYLNCEVHDPWVRSLGPLGRTNTAAFIILYIFVYFKIVGNNINPLFYVHMVLFLNFDCPWPGLMVFKEERG